MSIEEIKDIKKLQQMLKSELELRKYTYKCCQEAGEELAKNSFAWDGKEKNLVIQARELNERLEAKKQECEELKKKNYELTEEVNIDRALFAEIDQLKEQLNAKEQECERLRFPMQDTNYAVLAKEEFEEYKKLKQTLIEITEVCNSVENIENVKSLYDAALSGKYLQAKEILQKINEGEVKTMSCYKKFHWKANQSHLKNWKTEIEYVTDRFSIEELNKVISPFLRKGVKYEVGTFYDNGTVFVTIKYKVIDNLKFWLKELFKRGGND